ncbi:CAP domain-containing protein [Pyronema omphalodes]|nr:CAP domain-containing protein [Pyronema omphalodes]
MMLPNLLSSLLIISSFLSPALSQVSPGTPQFRSEFLSAHNKYRREHGVPNLKWDANLERSAQDYANKCIWGHSDSGKRLNIGECMSKGHPNPTKTVDGWVSERALYNYQTGDYNPATNHFTGIVWKGTTHVGCGAAKCGPQWHYVCHYRNLGNIPGQFQKNVFPPGTRIHRRDIEDDDSFYEDDDSFYEDDDSFYEDAVSYKDHEE